MSCAIEAPWWLSLTRCRIFCHDALDTTKKTPLTTRAFSHIAPCRINLLRRADEGVGREEVLEYIDIHALLRPAAEELRRTSRLHFAASTKGASAPQFHSERQGLEKIRLVYLRCDYSAGWRPSFAVVSGALLGPKESLPALYFGRCTTFQKSSSRLAF